MIGLSLRTPTAIHDVALIPRVAAEFPRCVILIVYYGRIRDILLIKFLKSFEVALIAHPSFISVAEGLLGSSSWERRRDASIPI
jgi:hypothetical protein